MLTVSIVRPGDLSEQDELLAALVGESDDELPLSPPASWLALATEAPVRIRGE